MKIYRIAWVDRVTKSVRVEAQSEKEALEKFNNADYADFILEEDAEYLEQPFVDGISNVSKLESGYLFKCIRDIGCRSSTSGEGERKYLVEEGEIVEFKCPRGTNFSTIDDLYLYLNKEEFEKNFELYGKILKEIHFSGNFKTKDILNLKLYSRL